MYSMHGAYVYRGAIHMHTTHSDGTKSAAELSVIAAEAGLDFIMITDHMTLAAREEGSAGWKNGVLTIVGYEHNDPADTHHFLIFGSQSVYPVAMTARDYVRASASDGALTIIAHPDEIRSRMKKYPPYPWTDWSVSDFTGIELWNQMSEWTEQLTPFNKLPMALSPRKSLVGPAERTMARWDHLNRNRRYAGIASVDAHAFPVRFGPLTIEIFPYKTHFRCLQTHLILDEPLSGDPVAATAQLFDAIRQCRILCCNVRWGEISESSVTIAQAGKRFFPGDSVSLADGEALLQAELSLEGEIRLIHDGGLVKSFSGREFSVAITSPGLYRLEVWKTGRGWLFTNHFRVQL